jgi:hypothetical protein
MHLRELALLLVAFLFCCAASAPAQNPTPSKGESQKKAADQTPNDRERKNEPTKTTTVGVNDPARTAKEPTSKQSLEQSDIKWTDKVVAIIAILAFFVSLFAVKYSHALINLERPWVTIYPTPEEWPFKQIPTNFPLPFGIRWDEINLGRTPAFVLKFSASPRILDLPLPDTRPKYTPSDKDLPPFFLPPNGERPHESGSGCLITKNEFDAIIQGGKAIVLYGFLKYEDTIRKKQHVSRFCFKWFYKDGRPTYSPVGPPDWIEYT